MDDKGLVLIFAFGTPGALHKDGTTRALRCALAIVTDTRATVQAVLAARAALRAARVAFAVANPASALGQARGLNTPVTSEDEDLSPDLAGGQSSPNRDLAEGEPGGLLPDEAEVVAGLASGPVYCGIVGSTARRCEVNY